MKNLQFVIDIYCCPILEFSVLFLGPSYPPRVDSLHHPSLSFTCILCMITNSSVWVAVCVCVFFSFFSIKFVLTVLQAAENKKISRLTSYIKFKEFVLEV